MGDVSQCAEVVIIDIKKARYKVNISPDKAVFGD